MVNAPIKADVRQSRKQRKSDHLCQCKGNTGLPRWLNGKESACQAGDSGLIPGSGKSPGEGNSNPLRYSCFGDPMDRGAWQAIVHGVTRVGHDLVTKEQQPHQGGCSIKKASDVHMGR